MEVLFRSPLGALLAKPWLDQAGPFGLKRWCFPLSRPPFERLRQLLSA